MFLVANLGERIWEIGLRNDVNGGGAGAFSGGGASGAAGVGYLSDDGRPPVEWTLGAFVAEVSFILWTINALFATQKALIDGNQTFKLAMYRCVAARGSGARCWLSQGACDGMGIRGAGGGHCQLSHAAAPRLRAGLLTCCQR